MKKQEGISKKCFESLSNLKKFDKKFLRKGTHIHPSAVVSDKARIGKGTRVWCFAQIRENAVIGKNCNIGNGVYIDKFVKIGNNVSIHNKSLLYRKVVIEDDVFIGPNVVFVNDKNPRSGTIRNLDKTSWKVEKGASIGASSVIMPDIRIGKCALIGAGSLVTNSVPDHALVYGSPAKIRGFVCECGSRLELKEKDESFCRMSCSKCGKIAQIEISVFSLCE